MRRSKTAKALLSYSKKEVSVTISEDAAQYLAEEAEGGIFEIEKFLRKYYLDRLKYDFLALGQIKCLSIRSSTGKCLLSSAV